MEKIAIVVAGGSGRRAGGGVPKQFRLLAGKPVLMHSLETLRRSGATRLVVVLHPDYLEEWRERLTSLPYPVTAVAGGESRPESVRNALCEIKRQGYDYDDLIAIHDGARPLLPLQVAMDGWIMAAEEGAAIPVVPPTDSLRVLEEAGDASKPVDRSRFRCVQTPQVFRAHILMDAYSRPDLEEFTDDASAIEAAGYFVDLFLGHPHNIKITNPGDLEIAEVLLRLMK